MKKIKIVLRWICIVVGILLACSVAYSGYHYTYYGDEVMHVHMMYLIASGYTICKDFFSIHAPLFHYLLLPFLNLSGFTLESFSVLRIMMIVMYGLKLWVGWLFANALFHRRVAWTFVFLMLLDPFAVFAGMQIRPDNLMMLVFFVGLLFLTWALEKKTNVLWFASGFIITLSVLVSMKIAVSAAVLLGLVTLSNIVKKQFSFLISLIGGCVAVVVLFILFFLIQGSFIPMLQQLLVDSKAMSDALWYPTRLGFFYIPNNAYIYGLGGKPITWYIALGLLVFGAGGALYSFLQWRTTEMKRSWIIRLVVVLGSQYAFLFTVRSMFVQYYLTVNWILCLFSAVFLSAFFSPLHKTLWVVKNNSVGENPSKSREAGRSGAHFKIPVWLGTGLTFIAFVGFCYVSVESIRANIVRPTLISTETDDQTMFRRWEIVPKDAMVYPVLLFRPLSQPIPYGYFIPEVPQSIRKKYPTDFVTMQNPDLHYLILTPYQMQFMDGDTLAYIQTNFTKHTVDGELWVRNSY